MYWRPWPEGVPHYNPATEFALYDMVLKQEEAAFNLEVEAAKKIWKRILIPHQILP